MSRNLGKLSENAQELGQAALELARAEAAAFSGELRISSRAFLRILLLFAVCLFILFWALAVLVFVGVEVGALWLPRWAAGLAVLGLLMVAVLAVGGLAWYRLRRLETPMTMARRRFDDHLEWWQRRIVRRDQ